MKTDFSVTIQVNIGVTPEVVQLVTAILTKQAPAAIQAPVQASEQENTAAAPGKGRDRKKSDTAPESQEHANGEGQQADNQEAAPEPAPESQEAPASQEPNKEPNKELTEEDVREAMNRARCRIEGEDWKDNTDGDLYKKYHRQLNATFKNISALLGADKPSALPANKRADFIAECDLLIVNDKGEISKPDAF